MFEKHTYGQRFIIRAMNVEITEMKVMEVFRERATVSEIAWTYGKNVYYRTGTKQDKSRGK